MCIAVPGKVISIEGGNGKVDFLGVFRDVSLELLNEVKVGDYVIVHAGYAIEKLKEEEAIDTLKILEELKEIKHDAE